VHDIDVKARTAGVDLWLWSVAPAARQPLRTLEFVNADQVSRTLESSFRRPQGIWSQVKVLGTFRQSWNFHDFPFDRQTLRIVLEEGVDDARRLLYRADRRGSAYQPDMRIPGWRVTGLDVRAAAEHYATTFGDPALPPAAGSNYARLVVDLQLERTGVAGFFKLTAALYAAVLLALVTFFLDLRTPTTLSPRMSLLAAALFAAVLNLRVASDAIGEADALSLLDELHVAAFGFILLATAIGILARRRIDHGVDPDVVRRSDRLSFVFCLGGFALVNVVLIALAAT
jgi:hypothetical protein